jgi:hypothetical protein
MGLNMPQWFLLRFISRYDVDAISAGVPINVPLPLWREQNGAAANA